MSIAALNQVYDEVRRLAIAGSDLAANDFRLKKLVPPLRKSATKAAVFGKVADSVEEVLGSTPKTSAQSSERQNLQVFYLLPANPQSILQNQATPIPMSASLVTGTLSATPIYSTY